MTLLKSLSLVAALMLVTGGSLQSRPAAGGPIKVEIRTVEGPYVLLRDGKPYFIKGGGGSGNLATLASHGGNSIRTWGTNNADALLDSAQALGLTVTMGLDVARERHGFDYNDPEAVRKQRERIREEVVRYRDHPALIIWAIGNELNLNATNPRVWDAVNDISKMIHQLDPNHLTTTTLAGVNADLVHEIEKRAPDLDLLSFQLYAGLEGLPKVLKEIPFTGPYMITEWGATGHWEVQKTPWDVAIENTSSVKADAYLRRYGMAIASDPEQCLGSYVFLWGQKQERTPTWYGVFLSSGEETESVDVMHRIWTGHWPANRTPRLEAFTIDGKSATDGVYVRPGSRVPVVATVKDPDGDAVTYRWDLKFESTDLKEGGDFETTPESIPGRLEHPDRAQTTMMAPEKPGAYRLFIYGFDGKGHAAHANIPFYVQE